MNGTVLGALGEKAPTSAGVDFSCEPVPDHKRCPVSLHSKGQWRTRKSWSERQASRDPPAVGHVAVTPCDSSSPSSPLLSTGAGKPLSTDTQGVTASPAPLPTRESQSLDKWVRDIFRGLVLPSGAKRNQPHILYITLNVIVYNLLIPWWWCPCMEYLVFGFLKTAWNKMYNSQSYLCFCNCCDKSTL